MTLPQIPRYRPGTDLLGFEKPPADITPELVRLKAEDGATSRGVLYSKGGEPTAVCVLHPRGDMTRHYLIPFIADAGFAVLGQESRSPNNDTMATHEALLADIAAAVRHLRERGYSKIIFLGYSGGGSVYSLYQAQALTAPPGRLTDTAAGDPFDLNRFDLPPADGIMFVGSHLGAGWMMQREIDPSVMDEADPLSCDPSLDMYNPDNGFREPPGQSQYSEAFLARYRAAQVARVARIDAIARSQLAEQRQFQAMTRVDTFKNLEPSVGGADFYQPTRHVGTIPADFSHGCQSEHAGPVHGSVRSEFGLDQLVTPGPHQLCRQRLRPDTDAPRLAQSVVGAILARRLTRESLEGRRADTDRRVHRR
jgi:hypothetical protein